MHEIRDTIRKRESVDELDELKKIFFMFLMMENTALEAGKSTFKPKYFTKRPHELEFSLEKG